MTNKFKKGDFVFYLEKNEPSKILFEKIKIEEINGDEFKSGLTNYNIKYLKLLSEKQVIEKFSKWAKSKKY